ncbi:hypothetical protein HPB50_020743 [Hyalomma asiaticum]|uniref:Uncharacterized protein n=1 Tax=Hyalomma asiaticum TaxID=266040 RepID=A0ACB7RR94_HYAAI|nr:hypothetical protein HPB50_020743 [Hyalomma asiaticum]
MSSSHGMPKDDVAAARRRRRLYDRILRVDHAGELGADRIYAGQMFVLGRDPVVSHMWEQEKEHLRAFERFVPRYRARPSALRPFWDAAGFALGFGNLTMCAASALLGQRGAMACTVAVESVISEHYNNQIRELLADTSEDHAELLELLQRCRDDEQDHHDTGLEHGAEGAPFYGLLTAAIRAGCRGAIWVAERV